METRFSLKYFVNRCHDLLMLKSNILKQLDISLQLECIENDNISAQHLKQKGLHLNPKGKS